MKNRISRKHHYTPPKRRKRPSFGLVGLFLVPALIGSLIITLLPRDWIPFDLRMNSKHAVSFISSSDSVTGSDLQMNPIFRDLMIEKLFWENRLAMSKEDSVAMTIDIIDSLLTLEIKGVVLYTCKLQKFDFNVNIKDLKKHPNLPEWLDTPFRLAWEKSSIPKVPLKIIQAPKDSIEAQYVISKILNSEELEDIQYSLHFDRNFRIDISQFQMETISEKQYSNLFLDDKSIDILGRVFSPKNIPSPSEELRMAVYLPQSDARTIYRALPKHASLAVRF